MTRHDPRFAAAEPDDYLDARAPTWGEAEAAGRIHFAPPFMRIHVEEYAILEAVRRVERARVDRALRPRAGVGAGV